MQPELILLMSSIRAVFMTGSCDLGLFGVAKDSANAGTAQEQSLRRGTNLRR